MLEERAGGLEGDIPSADVEALGRLYDAHARQLYAYARALGAGTEEAEDILQEVFVRLVRRAPRPGSVRNWRAFLFRVTRNEFYRWGRRILRRREVGMEGLSEALEPCDESGTAEEAREVGEALVKLPAAQREVVVMKVFGGLTFEEIGDVTAASANTAASRYRYGIAKLRALLVE